MPSFIGGGMVQDRWHMLCYPKPFVSIVFPSHWTYLTPSLELQVLKSQRRSRDPDPVTPSHINPKNQEPLTQKISPDYAGRNKLIQGYYSNNPPSIEDDSWRKIPPGGTPRVIDLASRLHVLGYIRFDICQAHYKTQPSTIIHGNNIGASYSAGLGVVALRSGMGRERLRSWLQRHSIPKRA